MLAPKTEEELDKLLRQILIEITKNTIKELCKETGIGKSEISILIGIEIDEIKVKDIPRLIRQLKLVLPNWGIEIEKKLEIWL